MFPFTAVLCPELQYYFSNFVLNSDINAEQVLSPAEIDPIYYQPNRSFIRLLFDDQWGDSTSDSTYTYLYRVIPRSQIPPRIMLRFGICNPTISEFMITDFDSTCIINQFMLQPHDLWLLNLLLEYRSTGVCDISSVNYNTLITTLSKLIYIYLDFKINNSLEHFNTEIPLSSPSDLLSNCYELYVANQVFSVISGMGA